MGFAGMSGGDKILELVFGVRNCCFALAKE